LVVLGTALEFFILELAECCLLERIVGIERVWRTIDAIIVGKTSNLMLITSRSVLILTVVDGR
jgi:hypothetical protein